MTLDSSALFDHTQKSSTQISPATDAARAYNDAAKKYGKDVLNVVEEGRR